MTSPCVLARDEVVVGGRRVGSTVYNGYTENLGYWVSLGTVGPDVKDGDAVEIIWGDDDGGQRNPFVRNHQQRRIRATVRFESPAHK